MKRFCGRCGARLDEKTGLCPNCDREELYGLHLENESEPFKPLSDYPAADTSPFLPLQRQKNDYKPHRNPRKSRDSFFRPAMAGMLCLLVIIFTGWAGYTLLNLWDDKQRIHRYPGGDYLQIPSEEMIDVDIESQALYFRDHLIVYTGEKLSRREANELAKLAGGEIVGRLADGMNVLQIRTEAEDLAALNEKAEMLMEDPRVIYAAYDCPVFPESQQVMEPWSDSGKLETDLGNEKNPGGNDWWAEAIEAYSAWKWEDQCEAFTIGMLDTGVDMKHPDLRGRVHSPHLRLGNQPQDHGTHVAGLMGARQDGKGTRGVTQFQIKAVDMEYNHEMYYTNTEYLKSIRLLIDSGAKVINNSWGVPFDSKINFYREYFKKKKGEPLYKEEVFLADIMDLDERYLKEREARKFRTQTESLIAMAIWLSESDSDFMIVESAGNGIKGCLHGIDAADAGVFRGIDKAFYENVHPKVRNYVHSRGVDYEDIRSHIMVVAAAKSSNSGNYKLTKFSNFGSNVDICAPGQDVFSTLTPKDDDPKNPDPSNNGRWYGDLSGTSMAAPIVSGCAAYVWSLNPELSAAEVREILINETPNYASSVWPEDTRRYYPLVNLKCSAKKALSIRPQKKEKPEAYEPVTTVGKIQEVFNGASLIYANFSELSVGYADKWDTHNNRDLVRYFLFDDKGQVPYIGETEIRSGFYDGACMVYTGNRDYDENYMLSDFKMMDARGHIYRPEFLDKQDEIFYYAKDNTGATLWTVRWDQTADDQPLTLTAWSSHGQIKFQCSTDEEPFASAGYSAEGVYYDLQRSNINPFEYRGGSVYQLGVYRYALLNIKSGYTVYLDQLSHPRTLSSEKFTFYLDGDHYVNALDSQGEKVKAWDHVQSNVNAIIYKNGYAYFSGRKYENGEWREYPAGMYDINLKQHLDFSKFKVHDFYYFDSGNIILQEKIDEQECFSAFLLDGTTILKRLPGLVIGATPCGNGVLICYQDQAGVYKNCMIQDNSITYLEWTGTSLGYYQMMPQYVYENYKGELYMNMALFRNEEYRTYIVKIKSDGTYEVMQ